MTETNPPPPSHDTTPPSAAPSPQAQAMALYSSKRFREALAFIESILPENSGNIGLLNIAAVCAVSSNQPHKAELFWKKALALKPDYVDGHNNLGILLKNLKRYPEAEACYRQALALKPDYSDAYFNLGNLLTELQRPEEAKLCYRQVLALRPDHAGAHNNLGLLFKTARRFEEAETHYRQALALRPNDTEARYNLGNLYLELKRHADAEACYRQVLTLRPDHTEAHYNLGIALKEQQRYADAEACYRRTLALRPDHADAHNNLGTVLKELNRAEEAEAHYRQALALKPDYIEARNNLGALLRQLKRHAEAEACYRQALALKPDHAEVHYNLGMLLQDLKRHAEAEACYRQALALKPDHTDARLNLGMLLLLLGHFEEGWRHYEIRYDRSRKEPSAIPPNLPFPQWQGQSLAGKSLVIWPEQGFGDEIQFCRYAPILKQQGARRITLMCKAPLKALFQTLAGIDAVLAVEEPAYLPPHDYWTFPLSIPLQHGTTLATLPNALPYLHAAPERLVHWTPRLPQAKLRVGLVWKGNKDHKNDAHRSLPGLATLAPLWSVPDTAFVSLQKGQGENEAAAPPAGQPLTHLGADIRDFADSAAILAQLDLLICVDTAIAHLAGALGKPCWVMLPAFGGDWRWQTARTDSPWYPGALRLFRQPPQGDWTAVVAALAVELLAKRNLLGAE